MFRLGDQVLIDNGLDIMYGTVYAIFDKYYSVILETGDVQEYSEEELQIAGG